MKHLTKTSLEQLSKKMPVLSESQQRSLIGGSGGNLPMSMIVTGFYTGYAPLSGAMEDEPLYDHMMDEITVTPQGAFPTSYGTRGSYIASNALGEEGVNEANNMDKILGYFEDTDCKGYDENTPWCAAFVSSMYATTGNNGAGSAAVAEWKNYGSAVSTPQIGDIAFFNNSSHVGIVTGVSGGKVTVTSGNYSDAVKTITRDSSKFEFRR